MGLGRKKSVKRVAACLAVLGLLLQASFSIVHASALTSHLLAPGFGQDATGVIVICTPRGLKTMRVNAGDRDEEPRPSAPEETCPVCTTLAGAAFALESVQPDLPRPVRLRDVPDRPVDMRPAGIMRTSLHVRGPPLQA